MTRIQSLATLVILAGSPAFAAGDKPFFSLQNTNFVVMIAFLLFIGLLVYLGVPKMIVRMLDARAATIKSELEEARALREEAKTVLASFERKQKEVQEQADRIVAAAKEEAQQAARQARADLELAIQRRIKAAEEQIASAETAALRQVRDQAVSIAVSVAADVLSRQTTAEARKASIDAAIGEVAERLH